MKPTKLFSIAGALMAIAGCWMPWIKMDDESLNGFLVAGNSGFNNNLVDFAGFIIIALAILSVIFSLLKKNWMKIVAILLSLLLPVISLAKFTAEKKLLGDDGKGLQHGNGFWLICVGAIIITASCLQMLRSKK